MFKQYLYSVKEVDGYLIFSLVVFFVFFIAVGLYTFFADKKYIKNMKNLPFTDNKSSLLVFLFIFGFTTNSFAQSSGEEVALYWIILPLILLTSLVLVIALIYLTFTLRSIFDLGGADKKVVDDRTFWQKFLGLNIKSQEKSLLIQESHDGIYELDNPTPFWFMSLFYGTIIIAGLYWVYYHEIGDGQVMLNEYEQQNQEIDEQKQAYMEKFAKGINAETVTLVSEPAGIESGKEIFDKNCVACHGAQGEGGVGPNLTDNYWLHGGEIKDVFTVISDGVPAKGMISWKTSLNPLQIQEVASFVLSLNGTNPPNAKAPQGELLEATSSLKTEEIE